jgi:hypothetical protein
MSLDKKFAPDMCGGSFHSPEGVMRPAVSAFLGVLSLVTLSGCSTTDGGGSPVIPLRPAVDAALAVPCQEAAGDKYFMDPDRVVAVSSISAGKNTQVYLKVDTRDALCTVSDKGKVVSLVDTSPKSADQIAAEELKATEAAAGGTIKPEPPVKKKKKS